MPNVPSWAVDMIADVAALKSNVLTIKEDVAEIKVKVHDHRNGSTGLGINRKWLSLGLGIGAGMLGVGTGIVTLFGS